MSLLQKASIITTPTAYAEDYLYSIKPAIPFGEELITNLDFTSGWLTFGSVTINNSNTFTSSAAGGIRLDGLFILGRTYTATITGTTGATLDIKDYSGSGSYGSTSGTFNHTFTFQAIGTGIYLRNSSAAATTINSLSIKEMTDADFDFDRNSTGTRVNEDYLIEDVPYNLASYSEDFSNSYWTKTGATVESGFLAPYGTANAYKFVEGANNGIHFINRTLTVQNATIHTASIFVKSAERTKFGMRDGFSDKWITINLSNGSVIASNGLISTEITKAANDWYKISFTFLTAATSATFKVYILSDSYTSGSPETNSYQGDGSSGVYIWGAQLVKGDQPKEYLKTTDRLDIPRIDYTNGEPSILLEPQRTNLIANNSTAGIVGSATITNNYAISPEGIQNSIRVVTTGTGNNSGVIYSVANTSTTDTFTYSIYVKGEKGKTVHIRIETTPYSLQSQELFLLDGTWQKFTKTIDYTGAPTHSFKQFYLTSISSATATDFQVYGAQMEEGSYATSLIHTSGSAVTRSADSANNAGNSDLINSTEGVYYLEVAALSNDNTFRMTSLNDGTNANVVNLQFKNTDNTVRTRIENSGVAQVDMESTVSSSLEFNKVALKFKANDFALWINGSEAVTDTSGSMPSGLNRLNFDNGAGTFDFYGKVKMVAVFKEALTDLELAKLTGYNNHELYMNYYNRLSYLGLVEEYNVESDINNYIL